MISRLRFYCIRGFILFLHLYIVCGASMNAEKISSVTEKILQGYNQYVIPISSEGTPVKVFVSMYLVDMFPTKRSLMHYGINCYFRMKWVDYRLQFNMTGNDSFLAFDNHFIERIWKPNIYFPRLKEGKHHSLINSNSAGFLYPNGTILTVDRLSMTAFCGMDFTYFPFDIQHCDFLIECYSYPSTYLILSWEVNVGAVRRGSNLHSMDFQEIQIKKDTSSVFYPSFGKYSRLIMNFTMYRHLSLYALTVFIPCILIVVLSWVSFWINYRSAPARVAFGVTTILTTITITKSVQDMKIGTFTSLDFYTLVCNLFVFSALVEYALVGITEANFKLPKTNSDANGKKTGHSRRETKMTELQSLPEKKSPMLNDHHGNFKIKATEEEMEKNTSIEMEGLLDEISYACILNAPNQIIMNNNNNKGSRRRRKRKRKKSEDNHDDNNGFIVFQSKQRSHVIDRFCRIAFPITFGLFNFAYFLYHRLHPDTVDSF